MDTKITTGKKQDYRYLELPKVKYSLLAGPLEEGLIEVGLDAFGPGMTREEIMEHILPTDSVYIAYTEREIVGFATAMLKNDAVDLVGAAIKEKAQQAGIYSYFTLRRINLGISRGRTKVKLRTHNPKVELGVRSCLDSLITVGFLAAYAVQREKKPGLYGRMLTAAQPYSGKENIDTLYTELCYPQGDAFALQFVLEVRT
ncbi:hypothetical protein HYS49_03935 [Candidatus Woesearchaeota archaeon]|nr:hypothetical protein [Candidatus Woesearchaeota archaeon]